MNFGLKRFLILFFGSLSIMIIYPQASNAYVAIPYPLRKLWTEAGIVVVCKVNSLKQVHHPLSSPSELRGFIEADIRVTQCLKGSVNPGTKIRIGVAGYSACYPLPRSEVGNQVLVFFGESTRKKVMQPLGSGFGVRDVSTPATLRAYLDAITRLDRILKIHDTTVQTKMLVEWFVQCVEQRPLRWDGAHELWPGGSLYIPAPHLRDNFGGYFKTLTIEQQKRILRLLPERVHLLEDGVGDLVSLAILFDDTVVIRRLLTELQDLRSQFMQGKRTVSAEIGLESLSYYDVFLTMEALSSSLAWDDGHEIERGLLNRGRNKDQVVEGIDLFLEAMPKKRITTSGRGQYVNQTGKSVPSKRKGRMIQKIETSLNPFVRERILKKGMKLSAKPYIVIRDFDEIDDFGTSVYVSYSDHSDQICFVWWRNSDMADQPVPPPELEKYQVKCIPPDYVNNAWREQFRGGKGFERTITLEQD